MMTASPRFAQASVQCTRHRHHELQALASLSDELPVTAKSLIAVTDAWALVWGKHVGP